MPNLELPNLRELGLDAALALAAGGEAGELPEAALVGAMTEVSAGKDTTTGHWELAGVELEEAFATFESFPPELVDAIEVGGGDHVYRKRGGERDGDS